MLSTVKIRNLVHKDHWKTPKKVLDPLIKEFGKMFDPCPLNHNMEWDGIEIDWNKKNFINPPYNRIQKELFIKKAVIETLKGNLCVMLLPVSTSTKIFHEWILPYKKEIRFIKGRVRFEGYNTKGIFVNNENPMHDSMIVIFDGR